MRGQGQVGRLLVAGVLLSTGGRGLADPTTPPAATYESTVTAEEAELDPERAGSTVERADMDRRLPRSAPDALRYEPGVFVQQSAHGQGSAYIRGLTGQQTLILFDGIRLNNSTYRQGPNQYFFTLDSHTIQSIEVERGGGSTRWGSDALGGIIDAHPIKPGIAGPGWTIAPRLFLRGATADTEEGGRLQIEGSWSQPSGKRSVAFVGGAGVRRAGLLTGPPVLNPSRDTSAGRLPWVPRYAEYDPTRPWDRQPELRTQLGTGFKEVTGDGRLIVRLEPDQELTFAAYVYREYDVPRTDQCPPPAAPYDQCLTYEEQFRHLAYAAWSGHVGSIADWARVTLSWQEQHERRRLDLTAANLVGRGIDDVETWGLTFHASSARFQLGRAVSLRLAYGVDQYVDWLRSRGQHTYSDTGDTVKESRGQYLDGSIYTYGGLYADLAGELGHRVTLRAGARLSWITARAKDDPASGSAPVDRHWIPVVGHAGVEVRALPALHFLFNYDASFRAPNLDDLTSRQQTGPGYQFENPRLDAERAHTFELGARLRTRRVIADVWLFETLLLGAILKVSKSFADCPPSTPQCQGSWSRFQLENAPSYSELRGAEGAVRFLLPAGFTFRATLSYVWSEGPRVGSLAQGVDGVVLDDRVPLSRTPPLNGTVEAAWQHRLGFGLGAALQWAIAQERLAIADYSDGRIPKYGTPGFAVVHLRASYRVGSKLLIAAVLENLLDSPYRFHGSSVNGAGRGAMVQLETAPF